jgi:uncharacterized membrane protein
MSCSAVDESKHSELLGIGVSLYGVKGYALMILLCVIVLIQRPSKANIFNHGISLGAIIGFAFSVYLTALEAFVIHSFCPHCIKSAVYMAVIFVAVVVQFLVLRKISKRQSKFPENP